MIPPRLRLYRPGDLDALYRICLETGDSGRDATALFRHPALLGQIFAAPYALFEPSLAFVLEDQAGVGGYCLAALNSQSFEQRLERQWWPYLRPRYPDPDLAHRRLWTRDEQFAHLIHHPWLTDDDLMAEYPSHLHIDLLPRLQGGGNGRRLMDAQLAALREQGSAGVHFHVSPANQRALGFYYHLGFTEVRPSDHHILGARLR